MTRIAILTASVAMVALMPLAANAAELSLTGSSGILDTLYSLGNMERISDQFWELTTSGATVMAVAKFSGFSQEFGVISGSTGGTFTSLLTQATDINPLDPLYSPGLSVPLPALTGEFRFGNDPSGAPLWSSRQSDNSDGALDHMVAWRITTTGNFVRAWEDLPGLGDRDYNDLVVKVRGAAPASPEPGLVLLIGAGLVGIGAAARRPGQRK